ncbi:MAG: retropepsin-like aspartic protease [Kiritimatiellae bacterium]|nr:retropepsin-like aspartic protease [Kiritimatiellia bacterium]
MRARLTSTWVCAAVLALAAGVARADTVRLKNGQAIEGIVIGGTAGAVRLDMGIAAITFPSNMVKAVIRATAQENEWIRSGWKEENLLHRKYLPPGLEDLNAEFTRLNDLHANAVRASQSLVELRAREPEIKKEFDAVAANLARANQRLAGASIHADVRGYNALVAECNALRIRYMELGNQLNATPQSLKSAALKIGAFQESLTAFEARLKRERDKRMKSNANAGVSNVFERMTNLCAGYDDEFTSSSVTARRAGDSAVVPAIVNGGTTGHFLVDTGASTVLVYESFVGKLGVDIKSLPYAKFTMADGRTVRGRKMVLKTMQVGEARAEAVDAAVLPTPNGSDVDGLLGMTFLGRFAVHLDGRTGNLTLKQFAP